MSETHFTAFVKSLKELSQAQIDCIILMHQAEIEHAYEQADVIWEGRQYEKPITPS
jgi:hypothetical protein